MLENMDESAMSLEEFVKLPTTVAFDTINTARFQRFIEKNPFIKIGTELGTGYVPVYINIKNIPLLIEELGGSYLVYPTILSPMDAKGNSEAGITPVIEHPKLELSGKGVVIGIIDTGIDYTKEVFRLEDGTSKILSIWDQTLEGARRESLYYGEEFSRQQINEALKAENPYDIVPSRDEDGHGTFLASVAAGRQTKDYIGAAPGADLVVVKLKRAHQFFVDQLLLLPDKLNYFQNVDVMLGIKYVLDVAKDVNAPVVICLGIGSNFGGHDGFSYFEDYISYLSQRPGYAVVVAAGNESNAKHHTQGMLFRTGSTDVIGIRVGEAVTSFSINIFVAAFDKISVGITSPNGEVISRVPFNLDKTSTEELIFEKTTIFIDYNRGVNTVITIGFQDAKEGIWEVTLFGDAIINGVYHAWLPTTYQVSPKVEFLKPVPEYTVVYPGNAMRSITCGAYNFSNNSLYVSSSWGPTRLPRVVPDFVAPGVNIQGIYPTGIGTMSGTSVAAAIATGAAAILMEFGIVQGKLLSMDGDLVRILLISGCVRDEDKIYPNIKWGFGKLNLYGTLWNVRESKVAFRNRGESY